VVSASDMVPALILTAGLGTRLDPLTRLRAKAAVPVAGWPLVDRILTWLVQQGVRDAVLNLHHLPHTVTAAVGDGAHLGLRVRYSWERQILGSAGGPRHALPLLDAKRFVVVNGDTLCDLDLPSMLAFHERRGASVTMAVVPHPAPDRYNGLRLDEQGRLTGFVPKGAAAGTWHFVGVQVVEADVFARLADGVPAETVGGLYRDRLAAGRTDIVGWRAPETFIDIGTPRDYLEAVLAVAGAGDGASVVEGDRARIGSSARLVRSVVWADAGVGEHADLEECVVAGPVNIPAGMRARRAVLVPASIAGAADRIEREGPVARFPL
jgi:mannose-1-phosphate guanylyltransferase